MANQQMSNCGLGFFGCVCSLYKYEGIAWGILDEKAQFNATCSSFGLCILAVVLEAGQAWGMRTWHRDQMSLQQSCLLPTFTSLTSVCWCGAMEPCYPIYKAKMHST